MCSIRCRCVLILWPPEPRCAVLAWWAGFQPHALAHTPSTRRVPHLAMLPHRTTQPYPLHHTPPYPPHVQAMFAHLVLGVEPWFQPAGFWRAFKDYDGQPVNIRQGGGLCLVVVVVVVGICNGGGVGVEGRPARFQRAVRREQNMLSFCLDGGVAVGGCFVSLLKSCRHSLLPPCPPANSPSCRLLLQLQGAPGRV